MTSAPPVRAVLLTWWSTNCIYRYITHNPEARQTQPLARKYALQVSIVRERKSLCPVQQWNNRAAKFWFKNTQLWHCSNKKTAYSYTLSDWSMFILHSRGSDGGAFILDESSSPAQELAIFQAFRFTFDFFPSKFASCSKPPSRGNHH